MNTSNTGGKEKSPSIEEQQSAAPQANAASTTTAVSPGSTSSYMDNFIPSLSTTQSTGSGVRPLSSSSLINGARRYYPRRRKYYDPIHNDNDSTEVKLSCGSCTLKFNCRRFVKRQILWVTILLVFVLGYWLGHLESSQTLQISSMALHCADMFLYFFYRVHRLFRTVVGASNKDDDTGYRYFGRHRNRHSSMNDLLGRVIKARHAIEERQFRSLAYGDYYDRLFDPIQMEKIFTSHGVGRERFKRTIMEKILQALQQQQQQQHKQNLQDIEGGDSSTTTINSPSTPIPKITKPNANRVGSPASAAKTVTGSKTNADDGSSSSHHRKRGRPKFVWATGGDSSTAGYGNLFSQSATMVLEEAVQPIFDVVGIDFEARNYAMSWYNSGPELALCMDAIYGANDVNVLMWDFAMQEEDAYHKVLLWAQRALVHSNLPNLFFVDRRSTPRQGILRQQLEQHVGFTFMDTMALHQLRARAPTYSRADAANNNNNNNATELPEALKYWVCDGGSVEGSLPCDDPVRFGVCEQRERARECLDEKYKAPTNCGRENQHSYHPGWKEHYYKGLLLAHFVLDTLQDALVTLHEWQFAPPPETDGGNGGFFQSSSRRGRRGGLAISTMLDRLRAMHILDVRNATESNVPPLTAYTSNLPPHIFQQLTPEQLFRGRSLCHTALLPSQARYLGISLDTPHQVGNFKNGGFAKGINRNIFRKSHEPHDKLQLAYNPFERRFACPDPKIDYKDIFLVRAQDGWLTSILPNAAEVFAYVVARRHRDAATGITHDASSSSVGSKQHEQSLSVILICLQVCPNDRCPDDYIGFGTSGEKSHGHIEITVNDIKVSSVVPLDHQCFILQHDDSDGKPSILWKGSTKYNRHGESRGGLMGGTLERLNKAHRHSFPQFKIRMRTVVDYEAMWEKRNNDAGGDNARSASLEYAMKISSIIIL